jgi:hypothetical protein
LRWLAIEFKKDILGVDDLKPNSRNPGRNAA